MTKKSQKEVLEKLVELVTKVLGAEKFDPNSPEIAEIEDTLWGILRENQKEFPYWRKSDILRNVIGFIEEYIDGATNFRFYNAEGKPVKFPRPEISDVESIKKFISMDLGFLPVSVE